MRRQFRIERVRAVEREYQAATPQHVLDTAHDVRRFRNALVHEEAEAAETLTLAEARRRLCRFLAFLPLDW